MAYEPTDYLRRYTDLTSLMQILHTGQLALLDPGSWQDRNDSRYLEVFAGRKNLKAVRALCFTQKGETYHHWGVFAPSPSGVCIKFQADALCEALHAAGVELRQVRYMAIPEAKKAGLEVDDLPFVKRSVYRDEAEVRALYQSSDPIVGPIHVPILVSSIRRVSLSPWLPKGMSALVAKTLRSIPGCEKLSVAQSTLVSNAQWQGVAEMARG